MNIFRLEDVAVSYNLQACSNKRLGRLLFGGNSSVFHALQGISLSLEQREVLGIIGRNGAGKSTLLKVMAGVVYPSAGHMWRDSSVRIFPLLSLGVGFFPELTGRENCFLSGALLGMSRDEVEEKIEDIKVFAEIDIFFDEPVKTYSSGMYARLAFSLATSIDADVLLIDEVLGVGDMQFSLKCASRMKKIMRSGSTVVIVSHNVDYLTTVCSRLVWIENGQIAAEGNPYDVAKAYRSAMRDKNFAN